MDEKQISVIIPVYNEAGRIEPTIVAIDKYMAERHPSFEICVIDDGSVDDTPIVLCRLCTNFSSLRVIRHDINRGKGYAVKKGILSTDAELFLMSDADLSTPIEELEQFIKWVDEGFDIVIGSRALKGSKIIVRQDWHRERMGKIYNLLVRAIVMKDFRDTQCGFKLFKSNAAKSIFSRSVIDGFSFDVEMLYIAMKLGYSIKEVPVSWINSKDSRVSILNDPLRMICELFKIRRKHIR